MSPLDVVERNIRRSGSGDACYRFGNVVLSVAAGTTMLLWDEIVWKNGRFELTHRRMRKTDFVDEWSKKDSEAIRSMKMVGYLSDIKLSDL